jgi:periplasmic protein TonB
MIFMSLDRKLYLAQKLAYASPMSEATLDRGAFFTSPITDRSRERPFRIAFAVSVAVHGLLIALLPGFRSQPIDQTTILNVELAIPEQRPVVQKTLPRPLEPVRETPPLPPAVEPPPPQRALPEQVVRQEPKIEPRPQPVVRQPEPELVPVPRAEIQPPRLEPRPEPIALSPRPEPHPEPRVEPRTEIKPEPKIEPRPAPVPVARAEPRPEPRPEPRTEVRPEPQPVPRVAPPPVQAPPPRAEAVAVPQRAEPVAVPQPAPQAVAPPVVERPAPPPPVAAVVASKTETGKNAALEEQLKTAYGQSISKEIRRFLKYPPLAQRRGWQGTAEVLLQLTAEGKVAGITIGKSSGQKVLDDEALNMVRRALPLPQAPQDLRGRELTVTVPIVFKLES